MKTSLKRDHEKVAKTSISLPPKLYDFATDRVKNRGFASLSSYLQDLIRKDAETSPSALAA